MPVFDYVCRGCQHEFQLRRPSIDARKKATCPECGGMGSQRLKSAPHTQKRAD